jgi:hypothetical protein
MYNCEFCESTFSSKNSLSHHQKTAKYCLQKQSIENNFICSGCQKVLSSKRRLETHITGCMEYCLNSQKDKYELELKEQSTRFTQIITEKDKRIKDLEDRMDSLLVKAVSRPTSVVNTTDNRIQQVINNLIPITDDHLKEQSRFLTLDHIKQGAIGYANFACEHALKDRLTCTDLSRRKIKYKNPEGQLVSDPEMTVMSKKLFTAISEKNKQLSDQYKGELINMMLAKYQECGDDMKDEETRGLENYIAEINKNMEHILTVYSQARDIAEGQRPEMYHEFVREVCNKTVS